MVKKWKILIICLLLLISYSIYEVSKFNAHIVTVSKILIPYEGYGDPYKKISLVGADDTENIKKVIMELSDQTGVSFTLSYADPLKEHDVEYYWYLKDEKYLNGYIGLNKNINLEDFVALNQPITNHLTDEYHFDLPLTTYNYEIYPFQLYNKSNLSTDLTIFADSEKNIEKFINGLDSEDIMYSVNDLSDEYERTFLDTLIFTMLQNPLAPLTFALFLITIFAFIYKDRRNLSIMLVNGCSKTRYILEINKELLWLQTLAFIGGFLFYYLFSFRFNFTYFTSILVQYLPVIITINIVVISYVAIIVYSFTDIDSNTYVQGLRPKIFTSYIIGIAKFTMSLLICISLVPSMYQIIHSVTIYQTILNHTDEYSNIYRLDSSGDYASSIIAKSEEIVDSLDRFDNVFFIRSAYPGEGKETKYKVVYANDNYIKAQKLLDENKKLIDLKQKNVVYTKANNIEGVEKLKKYPDFLCESKENCSDIEVIILDEDSALTFYSSDPTFNDKLISKDFVLVPKNKNILVLDLFFSFKNDKQADDVRNQLKDIVDVESISFKRVIDNWTQELSYYKNQIIDNIIILVNYIIIIIILSLIYFQIKFDKVKREFSIYWINGSSKFNYFYIDYLDQMIINFIMIMIVRNLFYRDIEIILVVFLFLIFTCIDAASLFIFRHQFYTQLQKNIKEIV